MNRSVLARQMFAKGGAAFPDLNKDGEITQADILMGRGVEFKQEGGIAGMMPEQPPAIAAGMAAGQAAMMPDPGAPVQEAAGVIDPTVVQQMLSGAAEAGIGDLENMEDPEDLMNAIRGDDASVEERYAELAQVVGPEDAQQTPESVLALVQPVMMMASVDQGIGELAQEEMSAPVEGAMAQGIMSTVAPPEPQPMPMEGAPPVNFKDGGLVRRGDNQPVQYYAKAGEVALPGTLRSGMRFPVNDLIRQNTLSSIAADREAAASEAIAARNRSLYSPEIAALLPPVKAPEPSYDERVLAAAKGAEERYVKAGLGSAAERAADIEEQKNLTQSQMLFDIAQTALTFAGGIPGERPGMSAAERLAAAASATKLPQTIAARAQAQREFERDAKKEERAMKLAAVQRGETQVDAEIAREEARELAKIKKKPTAPDRVTLVKQNDKGGEDVINTFDLSKPGDLERYNKAKEDNPGSYPITGSARQDRKPDTDKVVMYHGPTGVQSPTFDIATKEGRDARDKWVKENQSKIPKGDVFVEGTRPPAPTMVSARDVFQKTGFLPSELAKLPEDVQNAVRNRAFTSPSDFFKTMKMTPAEFANLTEMQQQIKLGVADITDKDYLMKFGIPSKEEFDGLDVEVKNRLMNITLPPKIMKDAAGRLVDVRDPENPVVVVAETTPVTPKLMMATIDGETLFVDINSEAFPAVQKRVNDALAAGKNASFNTVTSQVEPQTYLIEGTLRTSFDNGRTFVGLDGEAKPIPPDAVRISKETSYQVFKAEKTRSIAAEQLVKFDNMLVSSMLGQEGVSTEDLLAVKDAMGMARKGTGFYSNFTALLDGASSLVPSFLKPNWLEIFGRETQQARQYLRGVRVLGRSALVVNPRFPVAEMATVGALFPSPESFLADPDSEAQKFIELKRLAMQQYQENLKQLSSGTLSKKIVEQVQANNFELQRLMNLLPGVPLGLEGEIMDEAAQQEAQSLVGRAIQRGKGPN